MLIQELLTTLKRRGYTFRAYYDDPDDPDYQGDSIAKTMDALGACDLMNLHVMKDGKVQGWLLYIPGLDPEERIADFTMTGVLGELMPAH